MGLVGSNFVYSLFVTPDPWPGEENPVYVFLDHIPLSEVHQIRIAELNLHIGVPFEIAHIETEEERKRPKVYEIEACNSLLTITESTVNLIEETVNHDPQGLRYSQGKMLNATTTATTTGSSAATTKEDNSNVGKLYLEFTYDALEDCYVVVEFYVKVFKTSTTKNV